LTEGGEALAKPLLLNVNYPSGAFQGPRLCRLGTRPYLPKVQPASGVEGNGYLIGGPPVANILPMDGTDVALIKDGKASMTPLLIDQTEHGILAGDQLAFLTD
jgi:broad specificity polyphosphatase/5'/3'-nucleotidase SurE